ncbi:MAG TPA: tetratricopeptide repeat protein [Tepidisphaeraceae bacterium]|jgi:predicted O-linked N-acetylglucosamine transferase (SPINDLY family)|nr:tetratricopeptide repeat protein [Tepidisphaeraceae bacterium]
MSQLTIDQAMQAAFRHQQAGRLAEAEKIYRHVLAQKANHADALHMLGMLAGQTGRSDLAFKLIRQAIALDPSRADYHCNLGKLLRDMKKLDEAVAACRQALRLKPDFPEACNNLGITLKDQGKFDEAVAAYREALRLRPNFPEICSNLGNALKDQGKFDEAIAAYREALRLKPDYAMAYNNLGNALSGKRELDQALTAYGEALRLRPEFPEAYNNLSIVLRDQGKLDQAQAACQSALRLRPEYPEAHSNLGNTLRDQGKLNEAVAAYQQALRLRPGFAVFHFNLANALKDQAKFDEAIAAYRQALRLRPDYPEAYNNLGAALKDQAKLDEAIAAYHEALRLRPDFPEVFGNLGIALKDQGKLDEAIACFDRAIALRPEDPTPDSSRIYTMHFHPRYHAAAIFREQRAWNERRAKPLADSIQPHLNDPAPDRRLRIGYVSAYFYSHAEAFFVLPLLEAHDHEKFEIHCYAGVARPDELTERHRRAADVWHDVRGISHADLAQRVRDDGIDVLVDLVMHMPDSRLLAFARKPAPVQATWLAYPGGTGLDAMDYRFTDPYIELPLVQPCHIEQSMQLPDCWCVYEPLTDMPPAAPRGGGPVCFGSINNPCKLNEPLLRLWGRVLNAVPDSRLLVQTFSSEHSDRVRRLMGEMGILATRIDFVSRVSRGSYLRLYDQIDICLDPLPYNGITTTLDALWMGVPVVTLAGQAAAGRAGLSILSNAGLGELAAQTPDQFVQIAAQLASDIPRRTELRSTLRGRLAASPLMDYPRFARAMEAAYRQMWRRWCENRSTAHGS